MRLNFVGFLLFYSLVYLNCSYGKCSQRKRSPVILIPGLGGSQMEATIDRQTVQYKFCPKRNAKWSNIWINVEAMFSSDRYCLADNFRLEWNPSFRKMSNVQGVFTRTKGFGKTTGIEWLVPNSRGFGAYFYPLVEAIRKKYGYVRGQTIFGAPYDFRYDPGSMTASKYFRDLSKLIEETYWINGREKVVLVAHSMGAPYMLHFLRGKSQQWKNKYIKSLVTLGGAYGGALKSLKTFISGGNMEDVPKAFNSLQKYFREIQRTFSGIAYLFPDRNVWDHNKVLVETEKATYTVKNYDQLFKDMGYPLASDILRSVPPAWNPTPPGVKLHCFYGINVPTVDKLTYKQGDFPDNEPEQHYGNGDGTVNIQSLRACKGLPEVTVKEFDKVNHSEILANQDVIDALDNIL